MNNKLAALAAALFVIVFGFEVAQISGQFNPTTQSLEMIGYTIFGSATVAGKYVVPFELLSLILVAGIIGMFYISGREE
ncbi:MAG: hypothetical protein QW812_00960 [Thermoplasmataceae archaeon]